MGCDGGTIPTRDELVKLKKKPELKDKDADLAYKWNNCSLSQQPLRTPIVACELGRMYNKESVLELLLDRSTFECAASFSHIRSLKDIKELRLTENVEYKNVEKKGDAYQDKHASPYICPITGLSMNGRFRFVYLNNCGCVLAERAMKEAKSDVCLKCGAGYERDDIIIINGTDEDAQKLHTAMETRRAVAKLLKKGKRAFKKPAEAAAGAPDEASTSAKKPKLTPASDVPTPVTSKLVKTGSSNGACTSTGGARSRADRAESKKSGDKEQKTSSIQNDPKASKTFKALFTSHPDAINQPKSHWVTFNPQYFH